MGDKAGRVEATTGRYFRGRAGMIYGHKGCFWCIMCKQSLHLPQKQTSKHIYSVQFGYSVMSDSLPQHARPSCPSPIPGVHPNSCPLSRWCHPTISSSVIPFSSCLQSFPASGAFQMSQLFASGSQSIGVFSFNISPSDEHPGLISFKMDWWDPLAVQGTLKGLSYICIRHL